MSAPMTAARFLRAWPSMWLKEPSLEYSEMRLGSALSTRTFSRTYTSCTSLISTPEDRDLGSGECLALPPLDSALPSPLGLNRKTRSISSCSRRRTVPMARASLVPKWTGAPAGSRARRYRTTLLSCRLMWKLRLGGSGGLKWCDGQELVCQEASEAVRGGPLRSAADAARESAMMMRVEARAGTSWGEGREVVRARRSMVWVRCVWRASRA